MTAKTAAVMPSNTCTRDQQIGIADGREPARRGLRARQKPISSSGRPPPLLRPCVRTDGDIRRDDGLRHDDARGDQYRRPLGRSGGYDHRPSRESIAALASLQQQPRWRRRSARGAGRTRLRTLVALASGTSRRTAPVRPGPRQFRGRGWRAKREQGRNGQDEGDEKIPNGLDNR